MSMEDKADASRSNQNMVHRWNEVAIKRDVKMLKDAKGQDSYGSKLTLHMTFQANWSKSKMANRGPEEGDTDHK